VASRSLAWWVSEDGWQTRGHGVLKGSPWVGVWQRSECSLTNQISEVNRSSAGWCGGCGVAVAEVLTGERKIC